MSQMLSDVHKGSVINLLEIVTYNDVVVGILNEEFVAYCNNRAGGIYAQIMKNMMLIDSMMFGITYVLGTKF